MRKIITLILLGLGINLPALTQAADYTFTVSNIEQHLFDVSAGPDDDGFTQGVELPLISPVYSGTISITGSFSYDSSISGFMGNLPGQPPQPNHPGVALFPNAVSNLLVDIEGDIYSRNTLFFLFQDETTPVDPKWNGNFLPNDFLRTLGLPFGNPAPVVQTISIVHEGITLESSTPSLIFAEGDTTGFNFFPDAALLDPVSNFAPSSASLPDKLPPNGAEIRWFSISFMDENNLISYSIRGTMIITPAIPHPPEPPVPSPLPVVIDIDPWSADNTVLTNSDNPIPVGVFSISTVNGDPVDFDTAKINPATVQLGIGGAPNISFPWPLDHNGDYNTDVTYVFKTQASGIFCEDTEVTLTGETYSGQVFEGTGDIDASDCETGFCHPLF
jgi:hypothetical protein